MSNLYFVVGTWIGKFSKTTSGLVVVSTILSDYEESLII